MYGNAKWLERYVRCSRARKFSISISKVRDCESENGFYDDRCRSLLTIDDCLKNARPPSVPEQFPIACLHPSKLLTQRNLLFFWCGFCDITREYCGCGANDKCIPIWDKWMIRKKRQTVSAQ